MLRFAFDKTDVDRWTEITRLPSVDRKIVNPTQSVSAALRSLQASNTRYVKSATTIKFPIKYVCSLRLDKLIGLWQ